MRHGHTGVFEQVPVSPFVYKCGLDVHMRTMCGAEMVAPADFPRSVHWKASADVLWRVRRVGMVYIV